MPHDHETLAGAMPLTALVKHVRSCFQEAGLAEAALDARVLVCGILGVSAVDLIVRGDVSVSAEKTAEIANAVRQRLAGRPVYRILGWREFYGRRFMLSDDTLEPRPDTEVLVEEALKAVEAVVARKGQCRIADLGVGTGAIGLTLLAQSSDCSCLGVDLAPGALETAQANAKALGIEDRYETRQGNWLDGVEEMFDIIVSNPPYIPSAAIPGLAVEVSGHDPALALDGGADGLTAYRLIAAGAGARLEPGGQILLEIGKDQAADVAGIFNRHRFIERVSARDLGGIIRVVGFEKPEKA